jgi:hypothetical protein
MSDNTTTDNIRRCWKCLTVGDAVDRGHGWLHCPVCDQIVGHVVPPAELPEYLKPPRHAADVPAAYIFTAEAPAFDKPKWDALMRGEVEPDFVIRPSPSVLDFMEPPGQKPTNPKTLMGRQKLSLLSVVPPASIICEAEAMHYGAFEAPRKDGTKGYGPFNWRDDPVEMMIYLDAMLRHALALIDGEDFDPDSGKSHLGHAKACLGIIADAKENGTLIDDRPKVRKGAAARMLAQWKEAHHMTNLNGETK